MANDQQSGGSARRTEVVPVSQAQFESWRQRELPAVDLVRPGVWSIPVPCAHLAIRFTYGYVLDLAGGAIVIDPGWDSADGWTALQSGLARAGLTEQDVAGIVTTHSHPDHIGMAARLASRSGAWLAVGAGSVEFAKRIKTGAAAGLDELLTWGTPPEIARALVTANQGMSQIAGAPVAAFQLRDGEPSPLDDAGLTVIATPGHCPGHICIVDPARDLLFSGDHILPRITPHTAEPMAGLLDDPVGAYLESLDAVLAVGDPEVCPAHEYRFRGLEPRVAGLRTHVEKRVGEVEAAIDAGRGDSVWELARHVSWTRPWEQLSGLNLHLALTECASLSAYVSAKRGPGPQTRGDTL